MPEKPNKHNKNNKPKYIFDNVYKIAVNIDHETKETELEVYDLKPNPNKETVIALWLTLDHAEGLRNLLIHDIKVYREERQKLYAECEKLKASEKGESL